MEQTKHYCDPEVINCEDIPDNISLKTPHKHKKVKKAKRKQRNIHFYNMDNLIITKKLKIKKKKIKYFININTVCEKSESIVRSAYNICKKEAYYQRIVPTCMRKMCSAQGDISRFSSCCRSTLSREYKEYRTPKVGSLSPVSSIALTDVFGCNNISYEDVSNGSFSSDFEYENKLDTLIKRTKQRERQINHSHQSRDLTSTPTSKVDNIHNASPYSIDTDKKSIHSDNTMVLHPLSSEAYSPTTCFDVDNDAMILPYSTMTPDCIKTEIDYSPVQRIDDHIPYSPSFTPESIVSNPAINVRNNAPGMFSSVVKMEKLDNTSNNNDYGNEIFSSMNTDTINVENSNRAKLGNGNDRYSPRSPTVTPDFDELAFTRQINFENQYIPYSPDPTVIKQENIDDTNKMKNSNIGNVTNENDRFSPRSQTVTPGFDKFAFNRQINFENQYIPYSLVPTMIKQENIDDESMYSNITSVPNCTILTEDLIKKEIFENYNDEPFTETDYNMNNKINLKSGRDDTLERRAEFDTNKTVVKIEREDHGNVNSFNALVFPNNVIFTTDVKKHTV